MIGKFKIIEEKVMEFHNKKDKFIEYKGEWEKNNFLLIQKFSHIHLIKRYGFKNDFDSFRIFDLFGLNNRNNTFSFDKDILIYF